MRTAVESNINTPSREAAAAKVRAAELMSFDPEAGQKATDWIKFRESPIPANITLLAHALGLYRDPSRGHTHIVFREVEYDPKHRKTSDSGSMQREPEYSRSKT